MNQKPCVPFSDSRSRGFIWRTHRNARAFNAERHGEWEKMMHGSLQRPSHSTRTSWAQIEGPLSDWEIGICASANRYTRHQHFEMAGWTGLEPATFVVFPGRQWQRHLFSGSSVALFHPNPLASRLNIVAIDLLSPIWDLNRWLAYSLSRFLPNETLI